MNGSTQLQEQEVWILSLQNIRSLVSLQKKLSHDGKYNMIMEGSIILQWSEVQHDNRGKYNVVTVEPK
jgi:hypothetical protein